MNTYYDLDIKQRPYETAEILRCLLEEIATMERSFERILERVLLTDEKPRVSGGSGAD